MGDVDAAQWALEVADRVGAAKGVLEWESLQVTQRLNGTSELRAEVDPTSQGAKALEVYSRLVRAWRRPPGALASGNPGRLIRFAGHVHELEDTADADGTEGCSLVAKDPSAAMLARFQPWHSGWGPAPLNGAVSQLVGDLTISAEDPAGLDASYPHGLTVSAIGAGWPTVSLAVEKHTPGEQAFRSMQEGEAGTMGFYWTVKPIDPIINPATVAGGVHASMWVAVAPGSLSAVPPPLPRLEYGLGTLRTLAAYRARRVPPVNSVIATASGTGLTWKNDSESSGATYGLWPVLASFADVDTTARLDALARGVWHVFPGDTISIDLPEVPDPATAAQAPMLWDDFEVGDSLAVLLRGTRRTVSGTALVREATVTVDAEGTERLTNLVLDLAGVA